MVKQNNNETKTNNLIWICPKCGKKIESLYPNQLAFNTGVHKSICEGEPQ
jgi:ribosomal protein L37AE/L43A